MKSDLSRKFGLRIKFERMKRKLSQEQLAALAGICRTTMTKIEINSTSPTLDIVEKISKALGYEPYQLLKFDDLEI